MFATLLWHIPRTLTLRICLNHRHARRVTMGLVRRITVLKSSGETVEAVTVHQEPRRRPRVSAWTSPIERAALPLAPAAMLNGHKKTE